MAPIVELPPAATVVIPWPIFTAYGTDGYPLIGGRLHTFDANTMTPKAAYHDPFFLTPHENPIILDAFGQATVYLDGFYHLFLEDAEGVELWEVDHYTFSTGVIPSPGIIQVGSSEVTLDAVDGESVLYGIGLVPVGYRILGCTSRILEEFGTSHGLTAIALGDSIVIDRFGIQGALTVGAVTAEQDWHSDTELLTAQPYNLLVSARSGVFDGNGSLRCRLVWQTIGDTAVPGTDPSVITYGSAEQTLTASDGAMQLTATGLAPANARIIGLTTEVLTDFGTSRGLTGLALGDGVVSDRFGVQTTLMATTTSNLREAHSETQPIAPPGYTVLVSALGGAFSSTGSILVRLYWQALTPV